MDLPPQQRRRRIGPALVKMIKDHYADNAARQFELSGSDAAQQWSQDRLVKLTEENAVDNQVEQMQEAFDAVIP